MPCTSRIRSVVNGCRANQQAVLLAGATQANELPHSIKHRNTEPHPPTGVQPINMKAAATSCVADSKRSLSCPIQAASKQLSSDGKNTH